MPDAHDDPKIVSDEKLPDSSDNDNSDDDSIENKEHKDDLSGNEERGHDEPCESIVAIPNPANDHEEPQIIDDTPTIIDHDDDTASPTDNVDDKSINSDDHSLKMNNVVEEDLLHLQTNNEPQDNLDQDSPPSGTDSDSDDVYYSNEAESGTDTDSDETHDPNESEANTVQSRPHRSNAGVIERLEMSFDGKKYAPIQHKQNTQFLMKNTQQSENARKKRIREIMHVLLTQVSAVKGFKLFGERAVSAMIKELKQLNDGAMPNRPVVVPQNPDVLTQDEKDRALEAVNLIKEKRNGNIKGRTCANGSKQRKYVKEGEIPSSPTSSLESIMSTLVIDSYEKRYVVIADVPGAYLHAEMPSEKLILLKLRGRFVDIMCSINPE